MVSNLRPLGCLPCAAGTAAGTAACGSNVNVSGTSQLNGRHCSNSFLAYSLCGSWNSVSAYAARCHARPKRNHNHVSMHEGEQQAQRHHSLISLQRLYSNNKTPGAWEGGRCGATIVPGKRSGRDGGTSEGSGMSMRLK